MGMAEEVAARVSRRYEADGNPPEPANESDPGLACSRDAIRAVKSGDERAFLKAIRAIQGGDYEAAEPAPAFEAEETDEEA